MRTRWVWWFLVLVLWSAGCGKKTTRFQVPASYSAAKTAEWDELLSVVNQGWADLETLTVSRMRIEFTGGSREKGYLEDYPAAKGHLVAQRPNSLYLNILNPVTSSTVVTMAASAGRFQIWAPRENKYLFGRTDLAADSDNPLHSVRPDHLLGAILVESLDVSDRGLLYFLQEDQDARRKYYVIHELDVSSGRGRPCLNRKLWIERGELSLSRQQFYECGRLVSDVAYSDSVDVGGRQLSADVSIDRPLEHYTLRLEFEKGTIQVDRDLKESAFQIPVPPGAEMVEVQGDGVP